MCSVNASILMGNLNNMVEKDGVGCITEEGFTRCAKVKYVPDQSQDSVYIVKPADSEVSDSNPF